jgi:hypothetical protein
VDVARRVVGGDALEFDEEVLPLTERTELEGAEQVVGGSRVVHRILVNRSKLTVLSVGTASVWVPMVMVGGPRNEWWRQCVLWRVVYPISVEVGGLIVGKWKSLERDLPKIASTFSVDLRGDLPRVW